MAVNYNPGVFTDGLALTVDMGNLKSFRGPPVSNIASVITPNIVTGTGFSLLNASAYMDVPTLGYRYTPAVKIQNNYPSVSTWCCIDAFYYGTITVSPSTTYMYGIVFKTTAGYTHPNFMYRHEYNGGTYVTEAGVYSDANRVHLGDGWYYAWGTFTTAATTNTVYLRSYYYKYSTTYETMYVAKALFAQNNAAFTTYPAKFWPEPNSSLTITTSFNEMITGRAVTLVSPSYNADGTFKYDGSTTATKIDNTGLTHGQNDFTYSVWANWSAKQSYNTIFENGVYYAGILIRFEYNIVNIYATSGTNYGSFSFDPPLNTWFNLTFVRVGNVLKFYINGQYNNQIAFTANISSLGTSFLYLGSSQHTTGQVFNGKLDYASVYTRSLSDDQVWKNFQALRGRFGV